MQKQMIVALLIGVLLLVTAVQTFQLLGLSSKVTSPKLASAPATSAPASSSHSGTGASTDLNSLPSMVGGC